ncbi:MAG: hypothetical protein IJB74_00030 [Clostridia bacterium]|nr:hypothetical protein [Clostridia bacterium]
MHSSERKVQYIEAQKSSLTLYEDVKYYLIMHVPAGRLVRDKEIQKFLCSKFGVEDIRFEQPLHRIIIKGYLCRILDNVPLHREVSSGGYLLKDYHEKPLKNEGFETEIIKGRYMPRVKSFKSYLFDFEKETDIKAEDLKRINSEGLFDVLPEEYSF